MPFIVYRKREYLKTMRSGFIPPHHDNVQLPRGQTDHLLDTEDPDDRNTPFNSALSPLKYRL